MRSDQDIVVSLLFKLTTDQKVDLIVEIENTQFVQIDHRTVVKNSLKIWIDEIINKEWEAPEHILWSAIRRYGSLVHEDDVNSFLPILQADTSIQTKQTVFQSIQSIYERRPPKNVEILIPLAEEIEYLLYEYIKDDRVENVAFGIAAANAFLALVVMNINNLQQVSIDFCDVSTESSIAFVDKKLKEIEHSRGQS